MKMLLLRQVLMTSEEEVSIWAWTSDYDLIIVEGADMEPLYGIQNRHTLVIEIQEPVFANAVGFMIDIQEGYNAVAPLILEDGSITVNDGVKISFKPNKEFH